MYPEAKSVANWLKGGWHVAVGYVIGFMVMLFVVGWHPHAPHKTDAEAGTEVAAPAHH
jgi:hypothetical protein